MPVPIVFHFCCVSLAAGQMWKKKFVFFSFLQSLTANPYLEMHMESCGYQLDSTTCENCQNNYISL